jgi:hypothetical protein
VLRGEQDAYLRSSFGAERCIRSGGGSGKGCSGCLAVEMAA